MNLSDYSTDIAKEFKIPKSQATKIISFLLKRMRRDIIFGKNITLREIGTITIKVREPKPYLHLKKNVMLMSTRKFYIMLRVTKKMKDQLKKKTVF